MPKAIPCDRCKGKGYYAALVSQHSDETEIVTFTKCSGTGVLHQMTDEEEANYHANYW